MDATPRVTRAPVVPRSLRSTKGWGEPGNAAPQNAVGGRSVKSSPAS
jgi:hypothetical protein